MKRTITLCMALIMLILLPTTVMALGMMDGGGGGSTASTWPKDKRITLTQTATANNVRNGLPVKINNTNFTFYKPLPNMAPLAPTGFKPPVPGYTFKDPNYGPGTYFKYAPGTVVATNYKSLFIEMQDWVFYKPAKVKELAAERGLKPYDTKALNNMLKNVRTVTIPDECFAYQLTDTTWIIFGPQASKGIYHHYPAGVQEDYVTGVIFLEKLPAEVQPVLDRVYRMWNDSVNIGEYAEVDFQTDGESLAKPYQPNPNYFAIKELLNPQKGYMYQVLDDKNTPYWTWYSYEEIADRALRSKKGFVAKAKIVPSTNGDTFAFSMSMNAGSSGNDAYFMYSVVSKFLGCACPVGWDGTFAAYHAPLKNWLAPVWPGQDKAARDAGIGHVLENNFKLMFKP
jgi:hypothetical protein